MSLPFPGRTVQTDGSLSSPAGMRSQRGRTIPSLIGCPGILKANLIDRFLYSAKRGKERHLGGGVGGSCFQWHVEQSSWATPEPSQEPHIFGDAT